MRIAMWMAVAAVMLVSPPAGRGADEALPTITVWLMPNEPAANETSLMTDEELATFNAVNNERGVTVLNTVDPVLVDQLRSPHPDYVMNTWDLIKGQQETLKACGEFALAHRARVQVRFVTWGRVFEDLRGLSKTPRDVRHPPDVSQIGSTWAEYFAAHEVLLPPSTQQAGEWKWRDSPSFSGPASLQYLTDIRLLYFWKRRIQDPVEQEDFVIDSSSWEAILESLRRRVPEYQSPYSVSGMVMPIRRETNLIHRYAMLVNAGGATFFNGSRLDLTSPAALRAPLLLGAQANWQVGDETYRLLSFPDMSHEEATAHFREGRYLATIEPMSFLVRWKREFENVHSERKFWDYAGVAVPPAPFKGGSDLIVLRRTERADLAFALATHLAGSEQYADSLVAHGQLPVQRDNFGIAELSRDLNLPAGQDRAFQETVREALDQGREHAPSAAFPTEVESADALDGFQTLWRQVAEAAGRPDGVERIGGAAAEAEFGVNRRMVWTAMARGWIQDNAVLATVLVSAGLSAPIGWLIWRLRKHRSEADRLRSVRGFAASALQFLDDFHAIFHLPNTLPRTTPNLSKDMSLLVGLRGWRRARQDQHWKKSALEPVIWDAVIHAIESAGRGTNLVAEWEAFKKDKQEQGRLACPRSFLMTKELLRPEDGSLSKEPQLFDFRVICPRGVHTTLPCMVEQMLICLIHNAIKASQQDGRGWYSTIRIEYDELYNELTVSNEGEPIDPRLCQLFNGDPELEAFEKRILELLTSKGTELTSKGTEPPRPGIGLVETYCIANECFSGLRIDEKSPAISINLSPPPSGMKRWISSLSTTWTQRRSLKSAGFRPRATIESK